MADPKAPKPDPDAPTAQDQFKPAESHYGQSGGQKVTSTVTPITGNDGQQQGGEGAASHAPGTALTGNDRAQAGGGLGQNQQGYGQSPDLDPQPAGEADTAGRDAGHQSSTGVGARPGTLGPSPAGGASQPASPTTGGPDLSKGLTDNNRGGGF